MHRRLIVEIGPEKESALCSRCSAGRRAATSWEVVQARSRVWRGPTEFEGSAGQAVDRNKCTLQAQKPRIGPVTRSSSSSLDLLGLGSHEGDRDCPPDETPVSREHCPRHRPHVHLRMAGGIPLAIMGTVSGFRTGRTGPEGSPWSGHDRNKCTLHRLRLEGDPKARREPPTASTNVAVRSTTTRWRTSVTKRSSGRRPLRMPRLRKSARTIGSDPAEGRGRARASSGGSGSSRAWSGAAELPGAKASRTRRPPSSSAEPEP